MEKTAIGTNTSNNSVAFNDVDGYENGKKDGIKDGIISTSEFKGYATSHGYDIGNIDLELLFATSDENNNNVIDTEDELKTNIWGNSKLPMENFGEAFYKKYPPETSEDLLTNLAREVNSTFDLGFDQENLQDLQERLMRWLQNSGKFDAGKSIHEILKGDSAEVEALLNEQTLESMKTNIWGNSKLPMENFGEAFYKKYPPETSDDLLTNLAREMNATFDLGFTQHNLEELKTKLTRWIHNSEGFDKGKEIHDILKDDDEAVKALLTGRDRERIVEILEIHKGDEEQEKPSIDIITNNEYQNGNDDMRLHSLNQLVDYICATPEGEKDQDRFAAWLSEIPAVEFKNQGERAYEFLAMAITKIALNHGEEDPSLSEDEKKI
jgi:hypothetical protein